MVEANGWVRVASVEDMREGQGYDTGLEVAGEMVGLFMIDGAYYATGECTHEKGPLCQGHREGFEVSCPWHSARFDIRSGECLQGPVACRTAGSVVIGEQEEVALAASLACYDVKVEGGDILVRRRMTPNASLGMRSSQSCADRK
jgi:nitrite reductase/ring-hydroxylating ferredoxin subunit